MRSFLRLAAVVSIVASPAWAQLSVGAPASVTPPAGTAPVRWPAVAYSSVDDVFLAVSGAGNLQGQYFSATGSALGAAFVVNAGAIYGQAPRVAYEAGLDAFLVTWHQSIGTTGTRIQGRIIRHGQAALTGDLDLTVLGTNWEMGATVAWSSNSNEFLIAWQDGATLIRAQRVSGTGALLGGVITVEAGPYERDPAVAYDPDTDRFLVAYAGCVGNNDCFVHAQRVQAGTGALVGTPIVLEARVRAGYIPELAYNALNRRFLAVWFRIDPSGTGLYARTIDASGATGAAIQVSTVGSYDANGVAWNRISNTFLVVTHGSSSQDLAMELSSWGQPLGNTAQFGSPTASGNFNPRVAASTLVADWLGVTSSAYGSLTGQRFTSLTRDSGDAGTPQIDAGTPVIDAGTPRVDAGIPQMDAGAPEVDSGVPEMDAGIPSADAGVSSDAGIAEEGVGAVGSCGCSSASPGLFCLLAAAWLSSQRRRAHMSPSPRGGEGRGEGVRFS